MRLPLIAILTLAASALAMQEHTKLSFAALSDDDLIVVRYRTMGCFHYGDFELTFYRGAKYEVEVEEIKSRFNRERMTREITSRTYLGRVTLAENDVAGLDSLLERYRKGSDGFCTTRDVIEITLKRENGGRVTEKYNDGSCISHRSEKMVSFRWIVAKVTEGARK